METQQMLIRPITVFVMLLMMAVTYADDMKIAEQDYRDIEFDSITYDFILPNPFGESELLVEYKNRTVSGLQIRTVVFVREVDSMLLQKVQLVGEPSISVYNSSFESPEDEQSEIASFTITFEAGDTYVVELKGDPGCDKPCNQAVRDIAEVSVDTSGQVDISIFNTGAALTGKNR